MILYINNLKKSNKNRDFNKKYAVNNLCRMCLNCKRIYHGLSIKGYWYINKIYTFFKII